MKLHLLCFVLCISFNFYVFSYSLPENNETSTQNMLSMNFLFSPVKGVNNTDYTINFYGIRNTPNYYIGGGIQYTDSYFSMESGAAWYCFNKSHIKIGPYFLFNYKYMPNYMKLYNFLGGIKTELFMFKSTVHLQFDAEYMYKIMVIEALKDYIPYLLYKDIVINVSLSKQWNNIILLGKFASSEPFEYTSFMHPHFSLGTIYMFNKDLSVSLLGTIVYSDMFTLTAYIDRITLETGLTFRL